MTPQEFLKTEQELIVENFNENHIIMPQFVILRSTDKIERYIVKDGIQSDKQRDAFYDFMKKTCKQPNIIAAIQIMETWCSMSDSPTMAVRPSEDPDRKSSVIIVYYSKTEEKMFLYLEKDGKLELFENGEGKFQSKFGNPFKSINLKDKNFN
jgi:hypothetical protein